MATKKSKKQIDYIISVSYPYQQFISFYSSLPSRFSAISFIYSTISSNIYVCFNTDQVLIKLYYTGFLLRKSMKVYFFLSIVHNKYRDKDKYEFGWLL